MGSKKKYLGGRKSYLLTAYKKKYIKMRYLMDGGIQKENSVL